MSTISIRNPVRSEEVLVRARWCESYLCRLRGLTFRRSIEHGEGLLLVNSSEDRINASIHMWMVFFPLGVVWIDNLGRVVDKLLAKPWRIYFPRAAARYILESTPEILERIEIGDQLEWGDDQDP